MTGSGRAGLAAAAVAALGASFVAGIAVAGSMTSTPPTGPPTQPPVNLPIRLANADLRLPGSCDALLASYVERGVDRVGPYGWDSPIYYAMEDGGFALGEDSDAAGDAEPAAPSGGRVVEQGNSATGTNVQEVGVDEPDVVKTDGELLVRVLEEDVALYDVTGSEPVELGEIDLPSEVDSAELLLAGDSLVVVGSIEEGDTFGDTRLLTYDVTDPTAPALVDDRGFDADVVRAVQHDDDVRLVLNGGLPDLDFVQPRFWRDGDEATERNRDVVRDSTIEDWLPTVTTYDADGEPTSTEPLLDCAEMTVPDSDDAALGTMAVLGFDADDPGDADMLGIATDTSLAYFSPTRMYLATSAWSAWGCCWDPRQTSVPVENDGRSRLYAFELDGTDATYIASGVVDGVIEDRWSMDEHDGVLRVAVGPSQETGNFNSVVLLREDGANLEEIGRVDKLGEGEDIKSVRWFDSLAIVVTFRQVDPLYAIDLADPGKPELLGELKIPGFSEYLHPLSGDRLIGLGQDASLSGMLRGAQAAVFDVTDLTAPRRTDVVTYRKGSVAAAAADPRQFTWLPDEETALTVVSEGWEGRTGWVSVLTVEGGSLSNRMVEVEYGTDVDSVRLVPLPDGRIVLTTGEDVSFFEV